MSYQAIQWVLNHSRSAGADRLVLLAIAWHAGIDDWNAWPNIDQIAAKARVSRRTVFRSLEALETLGELQRTSGTGRGNPSSYRIPHEKVTTTTKTVSPCHPLKVTTTTKKGATSGTQKSQEESIKQNGVNLTPKDPRQNPQPPPIPWADRCPHCDKLTFDCVCDPQGF